MRRCRVPVFLSILFLSLISVYAQESEEGLIQIIPVANIKNIKRTWSSEGSLIMEYLLDPESETGNATVIYHSPQLLDLEDKVLIVSAGFSDVFWGLAKMKIELYDSSERKMTGPIVGVKGRLAHIIFRPTLKEPIPLGSTDPEFDIKNVVSIRMGFIMPKNIGERISNLPWNERIIVLEPITWEKMNKETMEDSPLAGPIAEYQHKDKNFFKKILSKMALWKKFERDRFIIGINYPWNHYGGDAGHNPYGEHLGFSAKQSVLEKDFRKISSAGITHVRLFLFADGRGQIIFDQKDQEKNQTIKTFDPIIQKDLEVLFKTAQAFNLKLILVLYDFYIGIPNEEGKFINRYPQIIVSEEKREYFEKVLIPILKVIDKLNKKYGRPVVAIEPMNEPENFFLNVAPGVFETLKIWVKEILFLTKKHTSAKTTFGSRSYPDLLKFWQDLKPDIWQFHFYDKMVSKNHKPIEDLNRKDLPIKGKVLIGEIEARNIENVEKIRKNGFGGIFFWSYKAKDGYTVNLEEIKFALEK